MTTFAHWPRLAALALAFAALAACDQGTANKPAASGAAPPPPEVAVFTVAPTPLTLTETLPGRLEASRMAEVRARASGIVLERRFIEGAEVKAGAVLFRIDPAPLQAEFNRAKADLNRAESHLAQAKRTAQRHESLLNTSAVSRQAYDDAVAARKQAEADLQAARADLESARLELDYATVTAPISGRIGRELVTVGALVNAGAATPMAIIQTIDPVYANLTQSSAEVLRLRQAFERGELVRAGADGAHVTLVLENGETYPHPGRLLFADITVDPSSGGVSLRAEFPNPDGLLLPGMYVRASLEQAVKQAAITIPQQALQRTAQGGRVLLVDAEDNVAVRPVRVSRAHQQRWVVEEGLAAGDRVIVEGLQKARPGSPVKPVPWETPADNTAAPAATPAE